MATRGRIGIKLSDGSILSSYHHWDSYPEWLGKKLTSNYNSKELASELIDGGDMSVCLTDEGEPFPQYYSLRGDDCPPRLDDNLTAYLDKDAGEEYHYVFQNNQWVCYDMHSFDYRQQPESIAIPA